MPARAQTRSEMNAAFDALPEWLRAPFAPFRDATTILLDALAADRAFNRAICPPSPFRSSLLT